MSGELERRASDAEREQAVVRLRDASAEGRLTLEELADRTALAYRATTHEDLEPLTADLPATSSPTAPAVRERRRWLVALLAPVTRSGRSGFGERNVVLSLFGPARLAELRENEAPLGIEEAEAAAAALAETIQPEPRIASGEYLDALGSASRRLELALGESSASPFAATMQSALGAVEELAADVDGNYKLPLG